VLSAIQYLVERWLARSERRSAINPSVYRAAATTHTTHATEPAHAHLS
jgi:polar amino acid transport system permease protein